MLPTKTKQYNNRVHTSSNITPLQASLKKNEEFVHKNSFDKRKIIKPKFQIRRNVGVADLKRFFPKGETTNWSHKMYAKCRN